MKSIPPTAFTRAMLAVAMSAGVAAAQQPAADPGALPAPGTYSLDPPHTFVGFAAKHLVVGMVRGRFDKISGTLTVARNPADCSVDVSVDAGSLSTQNSVRDEDLRSPAFFDAASYPTATYRGHGIRRTADGWVMDGSLTIRGVSKVVPLSFKFTGTAALEAGKGTRVAFQATAATRRADFNMVRDLLSEIGAQSTRPDVWLEIDAEALAMGKAKP
jgi:polyisoprenoid-binding protein YceI